jgi:hypothetical protein
VQLISGGSAIATGAAPMVLPAMIPAVAVAATKKHVSRKVVLVMTLPDERQRM